MYGKLIAWAALHFGSAADKVLHALAGALVCAVVLLVTRSVPAGIVAAALVGVVKEVHDYRRRGEGFTPDALDAIATAAGGLALAAAVDLFGLARPVFGP
jgi:hypothetical protein